jgi:hypothetical protein
MDFSRSLIEERLKFMVILLIALAGILGMTALVGTLSLVRKFKLGKVDVGFSLGSLFFRSPTSARLYGVATYYGFGLFLSGAYAILAATAPVQNTGTVLLLSFLAAIVQGLTAALVLVITSQNHPISKLRRVSIATAAFHAVGHVLYGLCVGLVLAAFWQDIHQTLEAVLSGRHSGDVIAYAIIWLPLFGLPLFFAGYMLYTFSHSEQVRMKAKRVSRAPVSKIATKMIRSKHRPETRANQKMKEPAKIMKRAA